MTKWTISALFLCLFLSPAAWAGKHILPDACGSNKIDFNVKTEKDQPAPAAPEAGKAQIVFIESIEKPFGCRAIAVSCNPTVRFGADGDWVGAAKGNSYFAISVDPGVHHLCTTAGKDVGMDSFTAVAGKVYYYEAKVTIKATSERYDGFAGSKAMSGSGTQIDRQFNFSQVNEDEGKYRIKISELSTSEPKK